MKQKVFQLINVVTGKPANPVACVVAPSKEDALKIFEEMVVNGRIRWNDHFIFELQEVWNIVCKEGIGMYIQS